MITKAPLLVVGGTGTGIGKTVVATGLVETAGRRRPTLGVKPVESGGAEDNAALGRASTFHVTRFTPPYLLADAVSPHLAARRDGVAIAIEVIRTWLDAIRREAPAVVVELAGGLFTPLNDRETNLDLVRALAPSRLVLVAPDRLGVLHDVLAVLRAAEADHVAVHGLVLSAPEAPDASTGTNAAELGRLVCAPAVLASLSRAAPVALRPSFEAILQQLAWP